MFLHFPTRVIQEGTIPKSLQLRATHLHERWSPEGRIVYKTIHITGGYLEDFIVQNRMMTIRREKTNAVEKNWVPITLSFRCTHFFDQIIRNCTSFAKNAHPTADLRLLQTVRGSRFQNYAHPLFGPKISHVVYQFISGMAFTGIRITAWPNEFEST